MDETVIEHRIYYAQLVTCIAVLPAIIGMVMVVVGAIVGHLPGGMSFHPGVLAILAGLIVPCLFLVAAWLLGQRRLAGAVLTVVLFALTFMGGLARPRTSWLSVIFGAIGIGLGLRAALAIRAVRSANA